MIPLQQFYQFENFFTMPLTDKDIEAKPFVLLIGQYSVGKTSFINHLLGKACLESAWHSRHAMRE
jgi:EH domain-containing protein 1